MDLNDFVLCKDPGAIIPYPTPPLSRLAPILYTNKEGGDFIAIRAHSVFLPDGSVWDASLNGWRVKPR